MFSVHSSSLSLLSHRNRARGDNEVVEVNLESDEEKRPAATEIPNIDLEFDPKPMCCCVKRITVMRILLCLTSAITLVFACALLYLVHDMEKNFTAAKNKALAALNATTDTNPRVGPGSVHSNFWLGTCESGVPVLIFHILNRDLDPKNMFLTLEFTAIFILILALAGFWSAGESCDRIMLQICTFCVNNVLFRTTIQERGGKM